MAFARHADLRPRVHASRNHDGHTRAPVAYTTATAIGTGFAHALPGSLAGRTPLGPDGAGVAPDGARAAAVVAGGRERTRAPAGGGTGVARREPFDRHGRLQAGGRLDERQLHRDPGIVTAAT